MIPPGYTNFQSKPIPQKQNRTKSTIANTALVLAIIHVSKVIFHYEMDNYTVEAILTILYAAYTVFAAYNNPKDKTRF